MYRTVVRLVGDNIDKSNQPTVSLVMVVTLFPSHPDSLPYQFCHDKLEVQRLNCVHLRHNILWLPVTALLLFLARNDGSRQCCPQWGKSGATE